MNLTQRRIRASYDRQAGDSVRLLKDPQHWRLRERWGISVAAVLAELQIESVCEAGVGEGMSLTFIQPHLPGLRFSAFDLSYLRLRYAKQLLSESIPLFVADMLHCPLRKVDCILTNHAIEPNSFDEEDILRELGSLARFLVLIEPDYEMASEAQRERMWHLGYARDLPRYATALGMGILRHEPWPHNPNPLNEASLLVLET